MHSRIIMNKQLIEINSIIDIKKYVIGLKVIIFDLDDTLYSEKQYVRSGYHAVAKCISQVENAEEKLWNAFEQGGSAIDEVLKSENIYTKEIKNKCLDIYREHSPNINCYEGVNELLQQLRDNGYMLGIITDGRPNGQRAKINSLNLENVFDKIIITDELGGIEFRKPNDKAFRMMKDYFDVEYNEMCYIGDNVNKDFIAPEMLGMKCIWFRNLDGLYYV